MGERVIKDKFNIHETYRKMNITNPYRFGGGAPAPLSSLISYYKFEGNAVDSHGTNSGTTTNVTYEAGTVGQRGVFNGSSSKVEIPDSPSLSFGDGTTDRPFSVIMQIYRNVNKNQWYLSKRTGTNYEYNWLEYGGRFILNLFSQNSGSNYINVEIPVPFSLNTVHTIAFTYNGNGSPSGIKMYSDKTLLATTNTTVGSYVAMSDSTSPTHIGHVNIGGSFTMNGKIDEVSFWDKELTAAEISSHTTTLESGNSLI
jgi:hypothetical protein